MMKFDHRFAAWSSGELDDSELASTIDSARVSIEEHKRRFAYVHDSLSETEAEHCAPLSVYCEETMERLLGLLEEVRASLDSGDRGKTISLADKISRSSFQLGNALTEFKNQALLVRGPTAVPNLNLLYSLVESWRQEQTPERLACLLGGVRNELDSARAGIRALESATPDTPTRDPLRRTFEELADSLERFHQSLENPDAGHFDLEGHLLQLNLCYTDIHRLKPLVDLELRDRGETEFAEINRFLSLLDDVVEGRCGEGPLYESLGRLEEFVEVLDVRASEAGGIAISEGDLERLSAALCYFNEGAASIRDFQERRDMALLKRAKELFLEFGALLDRVHSGPRIDSYDAVVEEDATPDAVPERIARVYQAVDALLVERIGGEAYLDALNDLDRHLRAQLKSARTDAVTNPIQAMLVGLQSLRDYLEEGDEDLIREGVTSIHRGTETLKRVLA